MPTHGFAKLVALANGQFKQRVVGNQNSRFTGRNACESLANEPHLVAVDPAVLDREGSGGIDSQYGGFVCFHPRTQILGNVALVPA